MSETRNRQYEADSAELIRALREYQHSEGHCEITVKVQNGFVTIIETAHKRKPPKVEKV